MEPKSSLSYSQVPATCPCPEPTPSSLHPPSTSRRSILILSSHLRLGSDIAWVEEIKTHFMFSNSPPLFFLFFKNHAVYETVEKCNRAGQVTYDNLTPRICFACWVLKDTDTHSEYVILIAFPRQQSLRERTGVLHYAYIACIVPRSVRTAYVRSVGVM